MQKRMIREMRVGMKMRKNIEDEEEENEQR